MNKVKEQNSLCTTVLVFVSIILLGEKGPFLCSVICLMGDTDSFLLLMTVL